MLNSYHVHSNISDGQSTIIELIQAAIELRLDEIGISDHYVMLPESASVWWSMPLDYLPKYMEQIESGRVFADGRIAVKTGIEADYLPETLNELASILEKYPLDYVIGSVHFVDGFPIDECKEKWEPLTIDQRNGIIIKYWQRIREMAESRVFDIAGHLDLYKKFGFLPTVDISEHINAALDAIAQAGMCVEFNTSGWFKPDIKEAYPSIDIISACRERQIPFIITSDAHHASALTQAFDKAQSLLHQNKVSQAKGYNRRVMLFD